TAQAPIAGVWETGRRAASYLKTHSILTIGFGAILFALAGFGIVMVYPRKRASGVELADPQHRRVFAVLENIANGDAYPIQTASVKMGRGNENDIVLHDESVSRLQAVMTQDAVGNFELENKSGSNGTLVNHQQIEKVLLSEGDLISMGSTTLRFSP